MRGDDASMRMNTSPWSAVGLPKRCGGGPEASWQAAKKVFGAEAEGGQLGGAT